MTFRKKRYMPKHRVIKHKKYIPRHLSENAEKNTGGFWGFLLVLMLVVGGFFLRRHLGISMLLGCAAFILSLVRLTRIANFWNVVAVVLATGAILAWSIFSAWSIMIIMFT